MKTPTLIFYWVIRIVAALIMLQTLYFKFTAAEESVYIFTSVGMEPWGRIAVGVMELIASILILINASVVPGALLALGLMSGALLLHLTRLGIEIRGDGGYLFFLALIVFSCSIIILFLKREKLKMLIKIKPWN